MKKWKSQALGSHFALSEIFSLAFLSWALILGIPFLMDQSSAFLGHDVSSLALGIVSFYPWHAFWYFVLYAMLSLGLTFIVVLTLRYIFPQRSKFNILILTLIYFYGAFFFAFIKYPAYFADFAPDFLDRTVWQAAVIFNPDYCLIAWMSLPILFLIFNLIIKALISRLYIMMLSITGLMGSIIILAFLSSEKDTNRGDQTNILIIGIDSLRKDAITKEATPHLWTLKQDESTVSFKNHVVGIARTFPSWFEILSGRYAAETGIRHMFPSFNAREIDSMTMGSYLKEKGYLTYIVSDFAGDVFPRFKSGFEIVDTPNLTIKDIIRLNVMQIFRTYLPWALKLSSLSVFNYFRQSPTLADPKFITDGFLKHTRTQNPWAGILFFSTAHFPYAAPYPYYRKFSASSYTGDYLFKKDPEVKVSGKSISNEDKRQVQSLYLGSLTAIDVEIGRIMGELKKDGLFDQTIIIVTADHGEEIYDDGRLQGHGEHLRGEWVVNVPLLIKVPSHLELKKREINGLSQSIDIFPTILGLMGNIEPDGLSGKNYSDFILGLSTAYPRSYAYSETGIWFSRTGEAHYQKNRLDYPGVSGLLEFDVGQSNEIVLNRKYEKIVTLAKHRSLITEKFKLIYMPTHSGVKFELYDREKDPECYRDLSKELPEIKDKLIELLNQHVLKHEKFAEIHSQFYIPSL